jgi:hypothetical protein
MTPKAATTTTTTYPSSPLRRSSNGSAHANRHSCYSRRLRPILFTTTSTYMIFIVHARPHLHPVRHLPGPCPPVSLVADHKERHYVTLLFAIKGRRR